MHLPKRPGPYILTFLLLVLIALVYYISRAVDSPELQAALERARQQRVHNAH